MAAPIHKTTMLGRLGRRVSCLVTAILMLWCLLVMACGSGEAVEGTEMEVIFPRGSSGGFEIARVTVDVQCIGPNGAFFTTALEFENESQNGTEVWVSLSDLVGDCTFLISAFEPDGEKFCTGAAQETVDSAESRTVSVVLYCDVSEAIGTGTLDLEATPIEVVGNFCPFFHYLDLLPDDFQNTPGATTDIVMCASDMADENMPAVRTSCGTRCDGPDLNRLTITCMADRIDSVGQVLGPSTGTFADAIDPDGDGIPQTTDGTCDLYPPSPVMSFTCDQANEPGALIRITCSGGDGDVDCDKSITHELQCPP